jgi:serine/threonine protein kinase
VVDRVGQQLGNYRLTRLLGRGGFAEVYLGEHLRLNTQAAIKVLHTSLEDDDVEGFLREAQTVAHLKHAHIVRVFDFDVENHTPFLVMDYLPNGNILHSHPKGTPLPLPTIISYVMQVASALQYAHDEKLIHRDIKPENMLLDKGDTVVLSDFGIALMAQSSRYQSTQVVAGTAAYMAPEQFQGKPRRSSDQYALGVVVYEWLSGDRPFHGSFSEIASQHLFVPPPPLREKVSTISSDVERVVLSALEKDPQKRFGNVQEFAAALEEACEKAPTHFVTRPAKKTSPRQPSPAVNAGTTVPSSQSIQLKNRLPQQRQPAQSGDVVAPPSRPSQPIGTAASAPARTPADASATPSLEGPISSADARRREKTDYKPGSASDTVITTPRPWLPLVPSPISKIVLLMALVFLVMAGGTGLYYVIHTN